jgi:hypothetical protein
MKIIDALKAEGCDARMTNGNRWMYWAYNVWVVREKRYRQHYSTVIIETDDEDEAVAALMEDD